MRDRGPRRYRMTDQGEQPIWASKRTLQAMARDDALNDHQKGYGLRSVGNEDYDAEYLRERTRLEEEGKRASE